MIRKIKGKYVVLSETTGRKFGTYRTLVEAKYRLRQMEFFSARGGSSSGGKHVKKNPKLAKTIRKKSSRTKFLKRK